MKAGILLIGCCFLVACSTPEPVAGPDKQFVGSMAGAASGAGAGAVTGFQLGSATGPGAAVGAGLGFAIGGIRGYAQDRIEEQMMALSQETEEERRA